MKAMISTEMQAASTSNSQISDERISAYGEQFDRLCKIIVDQRLSDAKIECGKLAKTMNNAAHNVPRLIRLMKWTLCVSVVAFLLAAATVIIILIL